MTKVFQFALSPVQTPDKWQTEFGLRPLLVLGAFRCGDHIELVSTIDVKNAAALALMPGDIDVTSIAGGTLIKTNPTDRIDLNGSGENVSIKVSQDDDLALARDQNVIFTIVAEPDPDVVIDWIDYSRKRQNIDVTLILLRAKPGWAIDAFVGALENAVKDLGTVIIVTCDQPLGQPDLGAETERFYAPDAPGKANLDPPEPDAWRSALLEVGILEVVRRRFLQDARAVLRCDPSDLIVSPGSKTVCDLVQEGTGFLRFHGRRAYPFALGPNAKASLGDHTCYAFDGGRAENIWCVAPKRLPDGNFWRQFRVSSATPDPLGAELSYWRCMAVRYPGQRVAEIVPKTSLVCDDALTQLVRSAFSADPKLPPPRPATKAFKNDRILAVTTMKNEGPFLLEWIAWNRAIGVTDFLVYTNDCTDGTDRFFDLLAEKGIVEHRENPYHETGEKPQHAAYHAAAETELAAAADWVICMDVDEYINIHTGDGTLSDLFAKVPDATMISMTWRLFGNADIAAYRDAPIIEQFFSCAPKITRKPHQAWGFKTLFRNVGHYKKFGVHRPKGLRPEFIDQIHYVNGSGHEMPASMLRGGWRSSAATIGYDLVTLHHYSLRSADSFLVKKDRGRVNHVDRDQGLNYWFRMNHNAEEDRSILRNVDRFRTELQTLMMDSDIAAQHHACVNAHRAKIAELKGRPDYAKLYEDITGARLRALSKMLQSFGTKTFEAGPDAVPPDFHLTHNSEKQ